MNLTKSWNILGLMVDSANQLEQAVSNKDSSKIAVSKDLLLSLQKELQNEIEK